MLVVLVFFPFQIILLFFLVFLFCFDGCCWEQCVLWWFWWSFVRKNWIMAEAAPIHPENLLVTYLDVLNLFSETKCSYQQYSMRCRQTSNFKTRVILSYNFHTWWLPRQYIVNIALDGYKDIINSSTNNNCDQFVLVLGDSVVDFIQNHPKAVQNGCSLPQKVVWGRKPAKS